MPYDSDEIQLGRTGAVRYAPIGTTGPNGDLGPWPEGFIDFGYISTDGLTEQVSEERTDVNVWQSSTAVKSWIKTRDTSFTVRFMEVSLEVLSLYYGIPIDAMDIDTDAGTVSWVDTLGEPDERFFGIDVLAEDSDLTDNPSGDAWHARFEMPRGTFVEPENIQYSRENDTVSFAGTVRALRNAQGWSIRRTHGGLVLPSTVPTP